MSTAKSDLLSISKQQQHDNCQVSDDSGNFTASVFTGDGSHVTNLSSRQDPPSIAAEDGCYTNSCVSDYLTAPSTPRTSTTPNSPCESYLKAIFDNFNELYQDKMAWIDENIPGGDNHAHVCAKKNVLEHWVKDVIEQNNILVQTVEELEAEAEKKVQTLQRKVHEAAELAKEHMGMIKEYEEQIKHLMKEKHIVEKQEEFFRKESMYLEKEKRRALERLHTLENDNSSLVTLINRIRDMGVWDINGLNFSPRTYDCIFGLYPNLAGSEVQTVFTREKARNLEKAETNVAQLMAQVEQLNDRKNEAERLLTEKTKVTEELQGDIKELNSKIKQYQEEHQEFKRSLKETQEQLKAATLKNVSRPSTADTKRDSEMKEMLNELRDLRNQLNVACTERQQAMKESNSLKMELRGRIAQMEDMKCLLDQIQTEAASTRHAVQDVQDKQDQMTSLKEKVNFYQTSYENSNLLLEAKSEIIVKLQSQMESLHEKMLAMDGQIKQETTHSDATGGDRDSGHLSDFSDCWNWNTNDEPIIDKEIHQPNNSETPLSAMESSYSHNQHLQSSTNHEFDRIEQLIAENQRLRDEKNELEQLNLGLRRENATAKAAHTKEIDSKDIEITMQKDPVSSSLRKNDQLISHYNSICTTQRALSSYREKVGTHSRDLSNAKINGERLRSQAETLEKDMLMYRSYVLLGELEKDKDLLMIGDCSGITNSIIDDDGFSELKNTWEKQIKELRESTISLDAQIVEKSAETELIQLEANNMKLKIDQLFTQAESFRQFFENEKAENFRLVSKIEELEKKQLEVDETLLMESEFKKLHDEANTYDTGLLLAERRLSIIQQSYEELAEEVRRKDDAITQRDLQIAKLETYIRGEKATKSSSNHDSGVSCLLSESHFTLTSVECNNEHSTSKNSEDERVQKLLWLVSALRKKLKKKTDLDRKYQLDKEILVKTISTMSFTWDELRRCCENLRKENLYLQNKMESLAIPCHTPSPIPQITLASEGRAVMSSTPISSTHHHQPQFNISTTPILKDEESQPHQHYNHNVPKTCDCNSIKQQPLARSNSNTKGIDIMTKVLSVLEDCVTSVSKVLKEST